VERRFGAPRGLPLKPSPSRTRPGQITLEWNSSPGQAYQLQAAETLVEAIWQDCPAPTTMNAFLRPFNSNPADLGARGENLSEGSSTGPASLSDRGVD
jgi:hypothetical protein